MDNPAIVSLVSPDNTVTYSEEKTRDFKSPGAITSANEAAEQRTEAHSSIHNQSVDMTASQKLLL